MKKAYIIKDGQVIAQAKTALKNGSDVEFSRDSCEEALNASKSVNLVNARWGKISRAKKWDKATERSFLLSAKEVNEGEFLIL